MTGPPLLTDRLQLRDFVEDDWRAVHEYDADPDVVYFMTWGPNSEQDSRDFVGRNITASRTTPRTDFELAVVEQDTSRLVGGAGLGVTPAHRKAFLGYCHGMPSTGAITIWRPRRGRVSCGRSRGDGTASKLTGGIAAVEVVSSACGHSNATAGGANVSRINRLMVFLCSNGTGR